MEDKHCPGIDPKLYSVILEKCLKTLGLPNTYSAIGGGECGKAFLVNGKVYKITTDKSEAVESAKLIGKRNNFLADIYDVKQINTTLTNTPTFLVVSEKLRTDRDSIFYEMQEELMNIISQEIGEHLFDILYYYRFRPEYYNQVYKPEIDAVLQEHQREKYYYDSLIRICDDLRKNNIQSLDLQYHNLGLKPNGNLAFFDIGFGEEEAGRLNAIDIGEAEIDQIVERVMSYMKGSSSVKVKKKCQLGGLGNGKSVACNQGDISNLELGKINEGQDKKIEYGAVMLKLNIKDWNKITDQIEKEDVYDKPTFGIEHDPHVTILYGLHKNVTVDQVKKELESVFELGDEIEIELKNVSHFETPNYDVVKFDVVCPILHKLNKALKNLSYTSDYPEYHPHMSISYVKKGTGKKYDRKLKKNLKFKSTKVQYSTVDEKKTMLS